MEIKFVLLLSLFLSTIDASSKKFEIKDSRMKESYFLSVHYDGIVKQQILILLETEKGIKRDSIYINHLLWGPTTEDICDEHVQIIYPVRAGLGHFLQKTLILGVRNGKLFQALHLISEEEFDFEKVDPDLENYEAKISIGNCTILRAEEKYSSKLQGESKESSWTAKTSASYSEEAGIFYSDKIYIKNITIDGKNKEKLDGYFHTLELKRFSYVFVKGVWYRRETENVLKSF